MRVKVHVLVRLCVYRYVCVCVGVFVCVCLFVSACVCGMCGCGHSVYPALLFRLCLFFPALISCLSFGCLCVWCLILCGCECKCVFLRVCVRL